MYSFIYINYKVIDVGNYELNDKKLNNTQYLATS
jgi:hypothetical protein